MFDVSSKPTLLVIDDIPENLTLMYQLLKEEYKIKGANSGLKGISIAESTSPDLILLDIRCRIWMALPCVNNSRPIPNSV